jgi:hypothetical protein
MLLRKGQSNEGKGEHIMNHGNNATLRAMKFGVKTHVKRLPDAGKPTVIVPVRGGYRIQRAEKRNEDRLNEKKARTDARNLTVKFAPTEEVPNGQG